MASKSGQNALYRRYSVHAKKAHSRRTQPTYIKLWQGYINPTPGVHKFGMYTPSQLPKYNCFFWRDITFQVAEFDLYNRPTPTIPRSHTSLYTTTIVSSPGNKIQFKVQNGSPVPARIQIRIQGNNGAEFETIALEDNSEHVIMLVSGDCFIEIMHVDLDGRRNAHQTFDNLLFHVTGIHGNRTLFSDQHQRDVENYHSNKNTLF